LLNYINKTFGRNCISFFTSVPITSLSLCCILLVCTLLLAARKNTPQRRRMVRKRTTNDRFITQKFSCFAWCSCYSKRNRNRLLCCITAVWTASTHRAFPRASQLYSRHTFHRRRSRILRTRGDLLMMMSVSFNKPTHVQLP